MTAVLYYFFCVLAVINCACGFAKPHFSYDQKPFVILIASYNNAKYAKANLISALEQKYHNYRIIFMNDCSTDDTLAIVQQTIDEYGARDKVLVIDNTLRKLGLRNYYEGIVDHTDDQEIIVALDGDDFLAHHHVLFDLNEIYHHPSKEIWMTYGQFVHLNSKKMGWNVPLPKELVEHSRIRQFHSAPTHLRTFYSWLFKRIVKEDLLYEGKFFETAWDLAFMFPMLEMSGNRMTCVSKVLYIYNDNNPLSDYQLQSIQQGFYQRYIQKLPRYRKLPHSGLVKCKKESCFICNPQLAAEIYLDKIL